MGEGMGITPNVIKEGGGEKVIRLSRPSVVVLCGPAACGKSTFAARHFRPTQIISSDQARSLVCDDERDQRYQTQAFALVHFLIEQRLSINRLCVVDSTALTPQARKSLLEIARRFQVPCVVIVLNVPMEKCLERDQMRERSVGRAIIERHYQQFEQARASLPQEGFDQIFELQDAELEKVRFEILFRPVQAPPSRPARTEPPQTGLRAARQGVIPKVQPREPAAGREPRSAEASRSIPAPGGRPSVSWPPPLRRAPQAPAASAQKPSEPPPPSEVAAPGGSPPSSEGADQGKR